MYIYAAKKNTRESVMNKFEVDATDLQLGVLMKHMYYYIVRDKYDGDIDGFLDYYKGRTYDNQRSGSYHKPFILKDIQTVQPLVDQFSDFNELKRFTSSMFRVWDKDRDAFGEVGHEYFE